MSATKKVRDRWMLWLLSEELAAYPSCATGAELYRRRLAGDEPSRKEWTDTPEWAAANAAWVAAADAPDEAAADAADAAVWHRMYSALSRIAAEEGMPLVVPGLHSRVWESVKDDPRALRMTGWHTCETTHCRGGWAIVEAGPAARELDGWIGSQLVAGAIYIASVGEVPDFFATEDVALADIERCAKEEE